MRLENVTFGGNSVNVGVNCPRCSEVWDAAPGQGTWSTSSDGQLVRVRDAVRVVRDALAGGSREDLERLREALEKPDRDVPEALTLLPAFEAWVEANPELWSIVRPVLIWLVIALLAASGFEAVKGDPVPPAVNVVVEMPTDEQIDARVREALEQQTDKLPTESEPIPGASQRRR